jgi:hypothetical protein
MSAKMRPDPNLPWYERRRLDGRMEPHVTRGDNGEIVVLDNGWVACFKDGQWHDKILFFFDQMAEFTPVSNRDEVYRVFNEARAALGLRGEDPFSN